MPTATKGTEVNLRTSKTLRRRIRPHRTASAYHSETAMANDSNTEEHEQDQEVDAYATTLNWATDENPDGIPLVHSVIDQVRFSTLS